MNKNMTCNPIFSKFLKNQDEVDIVFNKHERSNTNLRNYSYEDFFRELYMGNNNYYYRLQKNNYPLFFEKNDVILENLRQQRFLLNKIKDFDYSIPSKKEEIKNLESEFKKFIKLKM